MSAVKALQQWCRVQCDGYRDVTVSNMTTSFRDGLAFCAIIHKHRPDLVDFDSLKKENVYENNNLAFRVAEEQLGIPALLDAEDMVALKVPDRLSILTYVSQYYNYFHGRSPIGGVAAVKRPADPPADGPSGKKNAPVVSKVFPSSKTTKKNNPPISANITPPLPRPRQPRTTTPDIPAEKSHQTGTLSNECMSCNKHVHLVQRHLVDGKLYHRSCAKLLAPPNASSLLKEVPSSDPPSAHLTKSDTVTPTAPPRLGLSRPVQKPSPLSSISSRTSSPQRPASNIIMPATHTRTDPVAKRPVTQDTTVTTPIAITTKPVAAPRISTTAAKTIQSKLKFFEAESGENKSVSKPADAVPKGFKSEDPVNKAQGVQSMPNKVATVVIIQSKVHISEDKAGVTKPEDSLGSKVGNGNVANMATSQSKTHIDEDKAGAKKVGDSQVSKVGNGNVAKKATSYSNAHIDEDKDDAKKSGERQVSKVGNGNVANMATSHSKIHIHEDKVGAKKSADSQGRNVGNGNVANLGKSPLKGRFDEGKAGIKKLGVGDGGKTKAADTSKNLSKEENNNSKPTVPPKADLPKKNDVTSQVQTVKKEMEAGRGRIRLKVNPTILSDLQPPRSDTSPLRSRTPERGLGGLKPAPPNTSGKETPTDWRSMLKPVPKESKSADTLQSSTEVPTSTTGGSHLSEVSQSLVNPPSSQGIRNGHPINTTQTTSGSNVLKMKPDFIPKEAIMKELQEIEDNLNQLEKRGVELEAKLRHSEDEGEDDSLMDELMVEWFTLIRNKQVAIRRESELVYVGKTQDLEEQQPSVEQELRKLMEKPEHLKTSFERRREEELMSKLMDIVNDRNAIVEGLDEDRLREEEEDQELNKLMENFSVKKDKTKKKSPISKLFTWGNKKET
ncbi:protein-methionine sulfoxide oxidase mical2b isoform X1 [Hippocampus zosterae]|uniref:protein-methionine sulfoxide oxidase mical2b isoform X1 n=1 Tax=Hippocampus zosterae TaxID=109293 RepID=UPI00223D7A66|nr:protein-methionine sulfoxide oxidase mical2b isoform X1 [Hippocampus zosterae]